MAMEFAESGLSRCSVAPLGLGASRSARPVRLQGFLTIDNSLTALIAFAVVLSDGALSSRDPAAAAAGRGSRIGRRHNFGFTPCQNQKTPYIVGVVRTEGAQGAPDEAWLRDKAKGRGEKFLFGIVVTH